MSNTIKLSLVALLLVGCQNAYGPKVQKGTAVPPEKHVTEHVGHVTRDIANTQSAVTTAVNKHLGN